MDLQSRRRQTRTNTNQKHKDSIASLRVTKAGFQSIIAAMARFINHLAQTFSRKNLDDPASPNSPGAKITLGIGALIGQRYRLDAEIGRGGMDIVYRARDIRNGSDVAIKVVNVGVAGVGAREQFIREAQTMLRLHHPHIVAVFETGTVDTGAQTPAPFSRKTLGIDSLQRDRCARH